MDPGFVKPEAYTPWGTFCKKNSVIQNYEQGLEGPLQVEGLRHKLISFPVNSSSQEKPRTIDSEASCPTDWLFQILDSPHDFFPTL